MTGPDNNSDRETIWGINRKDRPWFQLLTLLGGLAGAVTLTMLELEYRPPDATPNTTGLNIVLGIGGSFVAAGFIAWGLLQTKELAMSIANWINDRRARNRARLIAQGYDQGFDQGFGQGYGQGYGDASSGQPRRVEATPGGQPGPDALPPLRPRRRRTLRRRP